MNFMGILKKLQLHALMLLFEQKQNSENSLLTHHWSKEALDWLEVITWLQTKKSPKWDLDWKLLAIHTTLKSMKISACSPWE